MKFLRKIHLWLSLPFGIIITLICFSGAMLVFEPEVTRALKKELYYVAEIKETPVPMAELMEKVRATLPDSVSITGVTVYSDAERTYQINLSKPRRASVFVDQYSGKILGRYERIAFFSVMFKLHRWLLDGTNPHGEGLKIGKMLVGVSTLSFVIALISGLIIWLPRIRKGLGHSLTIRLSKGMRVFVDNLHVAGGVYVFIFLLAMCLTGLTWSFDWYRSAFYAAFGVENVHKKNDARGGRAISGKGSKQKIAPDELQDFEVWQDVYEKLKKQNSDAPQITVGTQNASVAHDNIGNVRATDKYEYDRRNGTITSIATYEDTDRANKMRGWIYSVHTGTFGGMLTRIVWFLCALFGSTLPLTGYYIWIKRRFFSSHSKEEL